jgi:hypothetical protein
MVLDVIVAGCSSNSRIICCRRSVVDGSGGMFSVLAFFFIKMNMDYRGVQFGLLIYLSTDMIRAGGPQFF